VVGSAGTIPWAGGGHGGGPHVIQEVGTIQEETPPVYESSSGGPFERASAWVKPDTGALTVTRSYVTSPAGDQGTGWWVTPGAANALAAHERKHVANSREAYNTHLKPALERVEDSAFFGGSIAYGEATAKALVRDHVGWDRAKSNFEAQDRDDNEGQGTIDVHEAGYERMVRYPDTGEFDQPQGPVFGGTINGQQFSDVLKAPGETVSGLLPLEDDPALGHGHRQPVP
jgi:hypothetical protein